MIGKLYTTEVQQFTDDDSGDVYIELPPALLENIGWEEGDEVRFDTDRTGRITIKKVQLKTVELEFDQEELFRYMQIAHRRGISFNELCEEALKESIEPYPRA